MKHYIYLLALLYLRAVATSTLKSSEQFTKLIPSIITIVGYAGAFYFLSLSLKQIPVGIAYALWSAIGIVLIAVVGALVYKQIPDLPAIIGFIFIITGVVIINLFSKMSSH